MRRSIRRGQSLVEFALVAPVLLLLMLGVMNLGYVLFVNTQVEYAVREGARAAMVRPCPTNADLDAIRTQVINRLPGAIDINRVRNDLVITYTGNRNFGTPVTVTLTYQVRMLDPLSGAIIGDPTFTATSSRTIATGC